MVSFPGLGWGQGSNLLPQRVFQKFLRNPFTYLKIHSTFVLSNRTRNVNAEKLLGGGEITARRKRLKSSAGKWKNENLKVKNGIRIFYDKRQGVTDCLQRARSSARHPSAAASGAAIPELDSLRFCMNPNAVGIVLFEAMKYHKLSEMIRNIVKRICNGWKW